jgi:polysaccharide biosynthesis/export protein
MASKMQSRFGLAAAVPLLLSGCSGTPRPQAGYVRSLAAQAVPPEMLVANTSNSAIGIGDVLSLTVFREPDLSFVNVPVDPAGTVQVPLIGAVTAAGSTPAELGMRIRGLLRRYVLDPQVTVNVMTINSRPITVEGEVVQPGIFAFQSGMTLLSALAVAHGTTLVARSEEVAVIRTTASGRYLGVFDLEAIRSGRMPDIDLQPKDYIVVGRSGSRQLWRDFLQTAPIIGLFSRI